MDSQALQLTRTASLGSFDFELCVTPTAKDKAGNLTKSASCHADLDVTFKLLGKSPCKRKLEPILDEDAPATNDTTAIDDKPPRKTYLRLCIHTPPRILIVLVLFVLNLIPLVSGASFLHKIGGLMKSDKPAVASHVRVQHASSTATTTEEPPSSTLPAPHAQTTTASAAARVLAMPRVALAWPSGFTGVLPDREKARELLSKHAEDLRAKGSEITTQLHAAAQGELEKVRAQLDLFDQSQTHADVDGMVNAPNIAIAASAIAAQLPTLLAEEEPIYPLTDEEWEGEEEQGMESTAATELSLTPSPGSTRAPSVVQSGAAGAWIERVNPFGEAEESGVGGEEGEASSSSLAAGAELPHGFDLGLALKTAELCGFAYHSCDPPNKDGTPSHTERLIDELRANGLTLVKEIECKRLGAYGMLVRSESTVYVVFRGSANVKNLATDLQYHVSSQETMDDWADEAGMHMPQGLQVHSGFLEVWRSLRAELMDAFEELCAEERRLRKEDRKDLRLVVSGHSMGGAIAMFAALELASRLAKRESHPFGDGQLTYTFGAPRIGNAKFAKLVHHAFPKPNQLWALQRSNDAVPHLPFFSWGFRHPHGVAFLDPVTDKNMKPTDYVKEEPPPGSKEFDLWARQQEGAPTAIARSGDRGDDMIKLRPFGGKALKWASYHHIFAYLEPLQALLHVHYESEECQQEGEYPEHCPIFAA